jgi:hypothetical protein
VASEALGVDPIGGEDGEGLEQAGPASAPAVRPNQFGSVWDSQIGMAGRPERLAPIAPDDEDYAEPEIPEYLLAERRRAGRGQGQGRGGGQGGGGRGVRSSYASAVERERYGRSSTRYPEPARQSQPPRRRDDRPQRQPQPQQHRGGGGAPRSSGRDSAEPWSEVPPELEELLRAQLSTKLSRPMGAQAEAPAPKDDAPVDIAAPAEVAAPKTGARRGVRRKAESVPAEGSATSSEAQPEAQPEAAAKPASRSRRKPAATEAAADAIGEAPAEAAPKRRAPVRRKAAAAESAGSGEPAGE